MLPHLRCEAGNVYIVSMTGNRLLGTFEQVLLLAVLRLGDDACAPLVREELQRGLARDVSRGAVYVTLDRLEEKGLIISTAGPTEPGRGGRPRRLLAVSEQGVHALRDARESLLGFWSGLEGRLDP